MFSKSKPTEPAKPASEPEKSKAPDMNAPVAKTVGDFGTAAPKPKPTPSIISNDLTVVGNLRTSGDVQIEGTIEGDIRAHLLTVGESATIKGEIVADDVIVNGRVIGKVRGLKVRLSATARVEGDIVHKTIAIESGAHFEGSVQRAEDPLAAGSAVGKPPAATGTA